MSESDKKEIEISLPGEWAVKKLLGPIISELGEDFRRLYALGRDKIIQVACRKTENIEDGRIPNLRVTRDIFGMGRLLMMRFAQNISAESLRLHGPMMEKMIHVFNSSM